MADITKQNLRDRVLQNIGVLAAGSTSAVNDQTLVEEAIDAQYAQMRKFRLVPFPVTSIPDWAQQQIEDIVSFAVAPKYGITGGRLGELREAARVGEFNLNRQLSGFKHKRRTPAEYF